MRPEGGITIEAPLIYMHSDIPKGMTIREWRRERAPRKVHGGLIRTFVRALVPASRP
jgi:hypothetical protein